MTNKKDEKWLDEKMAQATDFGKVRFDAEGWKQKYILNGSHESSFSYKEFKTHKNIWRLIMESKITRYSAAAAVALATALVLLSPFGTSKIGGVVLADVQQKVAGIETMIIRGTKTFTHPGENGDVFEFDGFKGEFDLVKYLSTQHGLVEEGYVGENLIYRFTFNRPKRQTLLVLPPWKKYGTFTSTDKQMQLLENLTPKGIVNLLLGGDCEKLGRDTINGVEVEVFEFQDTEPFKGIMPKAIFDIQSLKGKVWIGIKEQMPVRVEGDFVIGKSFMSMFQDLNLHEVNTLGQFNVELDKDIFDISPPEGYTELTLSDILPLIPIEAKVGAAGLGLVPVGFVFWKRRRRKKATTAKQ
ncbi:MAG: hypothetical protein ACYTGS_05190 [Planctomycetota bacterium]|jgi:hypothetical protein